MVNSNKIAEIKIILEGLLKDIDSLSETEMISHLKWEDIFTNMDMVKQKLNSMRIEQERSFMKEKEQEIRALSKTIAELKSAIADMSATSVVANMGAIGIDAEKGITGIVADMDATDMIVDREATSLPTDRGVANVITDRGMTGVIADRGTTILDVEREDIYEEFEIELIDEDIDMSEPEWMLDEPGPHVDTLNDAITLNDKICFINDLFKGDSEQYYLSVQRLDEFSHFKEALEYVRRAFSNWDEESPEVYRFYMILRRRYDE